MIRPYRQLASFSRPVLEEYIRRGSWFPEELERVERELGARPCTCGTEIYEWLRRAAGALPGDVRA